MKRELPKLYSKADLARRWGATRQVVNNWENRHNDFPDPVMHVHDGSLPLYLHEDITKYEEKRELVVHEEKG
ncbi:hypothetical protein CHH58_16010 [Terribacillus saccharophilus]|uniref:hypothetical protein n=1 Tax=Terribacillus saccharophilus TaxID=361277 RepID=UPI000BA69FB8|nr:hypothetical protein [Terribacillus saccharophilus]PAF35560.1 hypothetical protein CHH58_16010 [Terribacillus saccharophilus]